MPAPYACGMLKPSKPLKQVGKQDGQESIRVIRSAIDRGITFIDNFWDYNNGGSEICMGQALRSGYRDRVFLMFSIRRSKQFRASAP